MMSNLSSLCTYAKGKVSVDTLSKQNYVSTENMLPNKGGIVDAGGLPSVQYVQQYIKGDILVSNIRPYFKKIWMANEDGGCSNDVLVFRAAHGCDSTFLYYVLSNDAFFNYASATSKGTKMPRGDKIAIMQYEVPCFDHETQLRIGKLLRSIDARITVNKKINDNLEQQAQALYKAWFVDLIPYNRVMSSDWFNGTVDDLAKEIICGKTPSTKIPEYYGGDIPFITIPDMHGKIYTISTERCLSTYGANTQAKKTLPKNAICVSCIGTAGLVTLVASKSQTNQQINSIIPKDNFSPYYIYLLMQTLSEVINKLGQGGSTIVNLSKAQFGKIKVCIPSVATMRGFDEIVAPLFTMILKNQKEIIRLSSLRDTLLPKLMSGELDVSAVQL